MITTVILKFGYIFIFKFIYILYNQTQFKLKINNSILTSNNSYYSSQDLIIFLQEKQQHSIKSYQNNPFKIEMLFPSTLQNFPNQNNKKQGSLTINKIILNPIQLLANQISIKQLKSKRHSLQTLHIIALTMSQKQIVQQLLPFLMKTLVQQNLKDIKLIIVKSLKNLLQLLNKQISYQKFFQMIVDILIVFEEPEIRVQAFGILNCLLFQAQRFQFHCIKSIFKKLIDQDLISITDGPQFKYSRQIILYFVKYLFKNQTDQTSINYLIRYLKTQYLFGQTNQQLCMDVLYQNLYLLVEVWPLSHLNELEQFFQIFINSSSSKQAQVQNQTQINPPQTGSQIGLQQKQQILLIGQKEIPQQQNIKIEQKSNLVQNSTAKEDQLQKLKKSMSRQNQIQLKSYLAPSIFLFGAKFSNKKAYTYLTMLMQQQSQKVQISLIKNIKQILNVFKQQNLQPLILKFKNFAQQPLEIKKALIEVIDQIPLDQQVKNQIISKNCKNSNELKNILVQSLIKANKTEIIGQLMSQSDYDFKVKIFIKLSNSSLHQNQIYSKVVDSLLSQVKKNFRSKLNIIQNIIARIQEVLEKDISQFQKFDISYMFAMLTKYFSDRIALIRTNIAKLCAFLLTIYKLQFKPVKDTITQNFYGQVKNWFQRQNVLIMIKQYLQIENKLKNRQGLKGYQNKNQIKNFFGQILKDAKQGIFYRGNQASQNKSQIKNISNLAQSIIQQFQLRI